MNWKLTGASTVAVMAVTLFLSPASQASVPGSTYVAEHQVASSGTQAKSAKGNLGSCTTFVPPNPNGAPMVQYYWNCNQYGISVQPTYLINGVTYIGAPCRHVDPGAKVVLMSWPFTQPGANYYTSVCAYPG